MVKHWTSGAQRVKRDGGKLFWRSACGRWLRLGRMAPHIQYVDCKQCAAYLQRLLES
jgi:hypothetical protein